MEAKNDELITGWDGDWDFKESFTSYDNIHSLHGYPARLVPDLVKELLIKLKKEYQIKKVLDPFMGSGTVAVEAKMLGLTFWGSDLNPLAYLITKVKTKKFRQFDTISAEIEKLIESFEQPFETISFHNIRYWFKEENILQLSKIYNKIRTFSRGKSKNKEDILLILLAGFSTTIRASSLSRNGEFKLYRIPEDKISEFKIDSIDFFRKEITRILELIKSTDPYGSDSTAHIHLENAKALKYLGSEKVDLILTSPPYGDSRTTVAYGQYSRLSLQWMKDLITKSLKLKIENADCDALLLGGEKSVSGHEDKINIVLHHSSTLKDISFQIEREIEEEKSRLTEALDVIKKYHVSNELSDKEFVLYINKEGFLQEIIRERYRMNIRKSEEFINNYSDFDTKEKKQLLGSLTDSFWGALLEENPEFINELKNILPAIRTTINRKLRHAPKRLVEVQKFFVDIFEVIRESDRVLENNGIQVWIVGHRTVFGKIEIQMSNIIREFFHSLGYSDVTSPLKRKCYFKRLPHHINSTFTRSEEVKTMGEEYILIVQKQV